jgi:hypothetical protein
VTIAEMQPTRKRSWLRCCADAAAAFVPPRIVATACMVCCLSAPALAADKWVEYRSDVGKFAALFPSAPTERSDPPGAGSVISHEFVVELGGTTYVVGFDDFATNAFAHKDPQRILDQARNNLVTGQPVKVLVDRHIALDKHPGREIIFADDVGYTQMYRIYLVHDRLYQTITGGPPGSEKSRDTLRFHNSFKILGP